MSTKPKTRAPRKKKDAVADAEPVESSVAETVAPEPVVVAEAPPAPAAQVVQKKGKKPVKVVAVVTSDGIEGSFISEPRRPLIAHLRIKPSEVAFQENEFTYNPNPPGEMNVEPYDAGADNMFSLGQECLQTPIARTEPSSVVEPVSVNRFEPAPTSAQPLACFYKADLMVQFKDSQEAKQLPPTTEIACFWCVHPFDTAPCIIPEREVGGTYQVYGNFCCPECAASYLLTETLDPHVRWERMALLQRIYDVAGTGRIFPAPARETLQLFGGPMSIESFRATVRGGKVRVDMHMPPMVSILGHIDTKPIDFFDTTVKNAPVTMPIDKVSKAEEGLRLKRSKPLKDKESTLDTVMNIQIAKRR